MTQKITRIAFGQSKLSLRNVTSGEVEGVEKEVEREKESTVIRNVGG